MCICYEGDERQNFSHEAILNAANAGGGKMCVRYEGESRCAM